MQLMPLIKNNNLFSKVRLIYVCFIVVYMAARMVAPLYFLIESVWVSLAVFLFGFLIVVWDLLTERRCLKSKGIDLLSLFIFACVISSIFNIKYGVGGNIKAVGALVLQFFLFYAMGVGASAEQKKKELQVISTTLCITWAIFVFFSIQMYLFDIEFTLIGGSWGKMSHGFSAEYQRLWGVFDDPNYASFASAITIMASVYLMVTKKKLSVYILGALNMLLQFTFIVLASSRSAMILSCATLVLIIVYWFVLPVKKVKPMLTGLGLSAVLAVAVSLVIVSLQYVLPLCKVAINKIPNISASISEAYDFVYDITKVHIFPGSNIKDNPNNTLDNSGTNENTSSNISSDITSSTEQTSSVEENISSDETSSVEENTSSEETSSVEENTSSEETSSVEENTSSVENTSSAEDVESITSDIVSDTESEAPVSSENVVGSVSSETSSVVEQNPPKEEPVGPVNRTDTEKDDISNGRFTRWVQSLRLFCEAPLFGASPRNVSAFAKDHLPDTLMAKYGIAPHNGYLDVLVGTGLFGTLTLIAYLVLCVITVFKKALKDLFNPTLAFSAATVFLLAGSAVFLSDIFMIFTFGSVFFFLMMGYAVNDEKSMKRETFLSVLYDIILSFKIRKRTK